MNIPANIRLGQLETNLVRLRSMSGYLGDRYVMVNIPAASDRSGRIRQGRAAPHGDRRQDRPPDADSQFEDPRDHPQSLLDRAGVDHPEGHHPADAQGSDLSDAQQHPHHQRGHGRGSRARIHRLEHRPGGRIHASPGSGQDQRDGLDEDQFPQSRMPSTCTTRRSRALFGQIDALPFVGLRARAERARSRHLAAARHARLEPPGNRAHDRDRRQHADRCSPMPVPLYFTYITAWSTEHGRRRSSATTSTSATASRNLRWTAPRFELCRSDSRMKGAAWPLFLVAGMTPRSPARAIVDAFRRGDLWRVLPLQFMCYCALTPFQQD